MFIASLYESLFSFLIVAVLHDVFVPHVCVVQDHGPFFLIGTSPCVEIRPRSTHARAATLLRLTEHLARLVTLLDFEHILEEAIGVLLVVVLKLPLAIVVEPDCLAAIHIYILAVIIVALITRERKLIG